MSNKQHWLREEEIVNILKAIDIVEDKLEKTTGRKLTEEEHEELVKAALKTIPSNKEGNGVDLQIVQCMKLLRDMMKEHENSAEFKKKFGDDFLRDALDSLNNNPEGLRLALKLIKDFTKELKNNPEVNKKYAKDFTKRFAELALKCVKGPDNLSNDERRELKDHLKVVFTTLKPVLEEAMRDKGDKPDHVKAKLAQAAEAMKQIAIYDNGGNIIDIVEGVFAPGSKASHLLSAIVGSEGKEAEELALEAMNIINDPQSDMVRSSIYDLRPPAPTGMA